jgi:hypothetical protein
VGHGGRVDAAHALRDVPETVLIRPVILYRDSLTLSERPETLSVDRREVAPDVPRRSYGTRNRAVALIVLPPLYGADTRRFGSEWLRRLSRRLAREVVRTLFTMHRSLANALVQLQARYNHCGEAASEK